VPLRTDNPVEIAADAGHVEPKDDDNGNQQRVEAERSDQKGAA